jgi:hypothetical protein
VDREIEQDEEQAAAVMVRGEIYWTDDMNARPIIWEKVDAIAYDSRVLYFLADEPPGQNIDELKQYYPLTAWESP